MKKLLYLLCLLLLTLTFFPSSIAYPKDLKSLRYNRVYRNPSVAEKLGEGYELGTRISFDIPGHVPNICDECQKPHGNCGVGLRCVCHPQECKDKVTSNGETIDPFGCFMKRREMVNQSFFIPVAAIARFVGELKQKIETAYLV